MRAIEFRRCGPASVLELRQDRATPRPAPDSVLVRVHAAGVNPIDYKLRSSTGMRVSFGIPLPTVPGHDFAGTITELGSEVSGLQVGDAVFGMASLRRPGSYAEFLAVPAAQVVRKPPDLSFAQAAALPLAGLSALQLLRRSQALRSGARVLIHGASGGVGSFAVQIARARGAVVTGVTSTRNTELVAQLGAALVIDYTKQSPLGGRYDAVIDTVGNLPPGKVRAALTEGGCHASCAPSGSMLAAVLLSRFTRTRVILNIVKPAASDLAELADLVASGQVRPVIDSTYPLEEAREAHRYAETGRVRGKIVLAIAGNPA